MGKQDVVVIDRESPEDGSTADLVRAAIADAKELTKLEIALAKNEAIREVKGLKGSVIAFAAAAVLVLYGIGFLLVTIALARGSWRFTLVLGFVFLLLGGVAAWLGVRSLPRKPLGETRQRLESDVQQLKERIA